MNVIKRDGTIQEFNRKKPLQALTQVYTKSLKQPLPEKLLEQFNEVLDKFIDKNENKDVDIEIIQDFIRDFLMKRDKEAAESFVVYREDRNRVRESKSKLVKNIATKLYAKNIKNQNANVDEASFGGRMGEATRVVTKDYALNQCMSKMARDNHNNGYIYIHDLDSYGVGMHNCLTNPIDKLLAEGFTTRQTDVRPASSVNTAMQLVAVIFQLQSLQQFGGVSASHLDWSMVPYVRLSFMKHYNEICDTIPGCSKMAIELTKEECKEISINDSLYTGGKYNLIRHRIHEIAIRRTNKEIHQAVEGLYHNLNTLQSRSGNQLPFSSINYGTCTLPEGRMVIKLLLDVSLEGLGKYGVTSIFPCGIFQYKKGVNDKPGTPNYDMFRLALKSTAQRIYPNYANCDWSVNSAWVEQDRKERQEYLNSLSEYEKSKIISVIDANITKKLGIYVANDNLKVVQEQQPIELFSTMGCRTVNGSDVNAFDVFKSNVQKLIKGQIDNLVDYYSSVIKDGRGNICPVTIILPKLAMESKIKVEDSLIEQVKVVSDAEKEELVFGAFMELLEVKIGEAKDMLIERFNWICSQSAASARFMYDNVTMSGYVPEEGIKSALKHGTIVIGQIGLAETLQIMFGCNHTTERGMEYAKKIEQLYKDKCAEYKKEYKLNFGVYYTPAESLCYTAMNKFVQQYGIIPNVSDKEYFTNSIHVPVWEQVNMFEKIDIESQLTGYSSAGCITYVELPSSAKHNIDALEQVVTYAMNKDIPYFAINVPIDNCCDCHYSDEIGNECPKCGGKTIKRLRRVTGYLSTTVEHFNAGKQAEVRDRTKHTSMDC